MTKTFDQIDTEAREWSPNDPLYAGINRVLANCDGEPAAEQMAILESVLCYEPDANIRKWFEDRGVRY